MASARQFRNIPPFPSNIPVASMSTISLAKLAEGDQTEAAAMLDACRDLGFFLLDLSKDPVGEKLIEEIDQVLDLIRDTMHISEEEKAKYAVDPPRSTHGYKAEGVMKTETGQPDRCEFFTILQDDLLGNDVEHGKPACIQEKKSLVKSYLQHGHYALSQILQALAGQLCLAPNTFVDLQPPNKHSGTVIRMIRYPPSVKEEDMRTGLLPHTDYGSVTLLANVLGGLQVLKVGCDPEDEEAWEWVKPQPGCLIVNMADAMVEWTGGILRSNMHRVTYAPGEQRFVERLSVAMLFRPFKEAPMKRLVGGKIPLVEEDEMSEGAGPGIGVGEMTAYEWEMKKSEALRSGKDCARSRGGRTPRAIPI